MENTGLTEDQILLKNAFETYGVKDYIIVEKNGVSIAITGIFGIDSLACVPNCPLVFKNPTEALKETVSEIKTKEKINLDIKYVDNMSLFMDIKVVFLTIKTVFTKEGAELSKSGIKDELDELKAQWNDGRVVA